MTNNYIVIKISIGSTTCTFFLFNLEKKIMNKRDFQDNPSKIHGDKLDLKKKRYGISRENLKKISSCPDLHH